MSKYADKRTKEGKELANIVTALEKKLKQEYETTQGVKRAGSEIIVPEHMTLNEAGHAILAYQKEQEEEIETRVHLDGHAHDALACFYLAMEDTFGKLIPSAGKLQTFFGPMREARMETIPISPTETMQVPTGVVSVPGLPIKMEVNFRHDPDNPTNGVVQITFEHKRMYHPLVKMIEERTRERLATKSIFKGKAIQSNFEFIDVLSLDESRIVYGEDERALLKGELFSYIIDREQQVEAGNNLKRGVLLYGPYGTGKSLTSLLTGKYAVMNEWTFMSVRPGDSVSAAINFAKNYQPAVVFFEDIDQDTAGERDSSVNEILNTMDGILSKNSEVIVVMTTNHIDRINRAMLRPGRLDAILPIGQLDQDSVEKMVNILLGDREGNSVLQGKLDAVTVYQAAEGYPPAFVSEGVAKAKSFAISEGRKGRVTSEDVVNGLKALRGQFEMMRGDQEVDEPETSRALKKLTRDTIAEWEAESGITETLAEIRERV